VTVTQFGIELALGSGSPELVGGVGRCSVPTRRDIHTLRIPLIVITRFGMVINGYTIVITPRAESRWAAPLVARFWSS
jgi:hypothetical protein